MTNRKTTILALLAVLAATTAPLRAATVTVPGPLTIVPLDVTSITTGGTAVTVLGPGEHTAGGYLVTSNAAGACFSENGTAGTATGYSGTTFTTCVAANVFYPLSTSIGPVSANSSASTVALSGYGLKE
jgi:hypothetical protein